MRILAIRGRNLASLAGDFEMRLDAPPLAAAGLFAITGRTGSGKSTILDALCLALFDRMPRLPTGRGVEVGRAGDAPESRLKDNDVCSVLRRGTGEGNAEVEFRGVDGRRYRAGWFVRLARERAGGRVQPQTMELRDLDSGEDLSGNKTEVLAAIQTRLGLTFDQFRRSVMLAQGDFAAFLRADAGERAGLLERITGTGIYGEISKAAHRRATEEDRQLELVGQRLGDRRPLDEEARNALETELAEARRLLDEQLLVQQGLQQARRWYRSLDNLVVERDQAADQLVRARADQDAAEARCRRFEHIRARQSLRPPLTAFDRANQALKQSRRDLEQSIAEERERRLDAERAATDAQIADAASTDARKAREEATPALREARRLDTKILGACEQARRAGTDCESARTSLHEARAEQDGLQARSAEAAQTREQAEDWLAAQAGAEPLAVQWEAWARELGRYARARGMLDKARADIEAADRAGAELAERQREQEILIAWIGANRARVATERSVLEEQSGAFDLGRLAALREERHARRETVEEWRLLVEQARETQGRLEGTRDALTREQARRAESDTRLREIEAEISPLAAALAEAEDAHRRLLLASADEVESLRVRLQEGRPCPVCGAEQHPWAERTTTLLVGLAGEQAARVAARKRQSEAMTAEKARKLAQSEQAVRRGVELASDLATQRALLDRTLEAWSAGEADPLHPADPFADGLVARLAEELEALTRTLQQIAGDEAKARALQVEIKAKTGEVEGLDTRLDAERKRFADVGEQIRAGLDVRNRVELESSRAEETMGRVVELVTQPLAGIDDWCAQLQVDPDAFIDSCRQQVEAWRLRVKQRDEAIQAHLDLAPRLTRAQTRRQAMEEDLARRAAALERQSTELAVLERERAALLDGRPADAVEAELSAASTEAQQRREQSHTVLAVAREALTASQGVVVARRRPYRSARPRQRRHRRGSTGRWRRRGLAWTSCARR